ncbi:MAG: hypothetical protein AB2A00_06960 [Myxococcota bacterium]
MARVIGGFRVREEHMWDLVGGPSPFGPSSGDEQVSSGSTPAPVDAARGKRPLTAGAQPTSSRTR